MRHIITIVLIFFTVTLSAQQSEMSLKQCLKKGIEANYAVKIAQNNHKIEQNNLTYEPFLPSLTASARHNQDVLSAKDRSRDNTIADQTKDYNANLMTADLALNWTLFDGMSMFATYETKKELLKIGELNLRNSVEALVNDIAQQYYYIITQKGRCDAARKYLEISTLRYNQAHEKYVLQTISGLEMTQAKMDFNADSSKLVTQQELLKNGYIQLRELMNVDLQSDFELSDTIIPNGTLELNRLIDSAKEQNTAVLLARKGEIVSELDLKIARSARYPALTFGAGYKFNHNNNTSSQLKFTQTNGVNWGFTLSAKLFNGMEVNRKIKNAEIDIDNSALRAKNTELSVTSSISQLYNTYINNFLMINFESESAAAAIQNLEAAVVMYRIGTMSGVEFREIQRSYLEAEDRKLSALFQAKISEISLKYLSGEILQ